MSGDETPQAAALGRIAGRAVKQAEEAVARVAGVDSRLDRVVGSLGEVKQMVSALSRHVAKLVDAEQPGQPVRSWMLAGDPETARALLVDLFDWLDQVYRWYFETRLPSCWMWHPAVVEELLTLRHLHAEAYQDEKSWSKAGDWHQKWLPGVRESIQQQLATCYLGKHEDPKPASIPPAVTPMVQHIDAVVAVWLSQRLPPQPTPAQLKDARTYDDRGRGLRDVSA